MIYFSTQDAIVAVIGSVGIIASVVIMTYSFTRNKTGDGRYQ